MAAPSRFCVFWIKKTIRNVMMVVPVLMISCHVSEKPNSGPVTPQITITITQTAKVSGFPAEWATADASSVNTFGMDAS
jgi:hypothetical protein